MHFISAGFSFSCFGLRRASGPWSLEDQFVAFSSEGQLRSGFYHGGSARFNASGGGIYRLLGCSVAGTGRSVAGREFRAKPDYCLATYRKIIRFLDLWKHTCNGKLAPYFFGIPSLPKRVGGHLLRQKNWNKTPTAGLMHGVGNRKGPSC